MRLELVSTISHEAHYWARTARVEVSVFDKSKAGLDMSLTLSDEIVTLVQIANLYQVSTEKEQEEREEKDQEDEKKDEKKEKGKEKNLPQLPFLREALELDKRIRVRNQ